MHRSLRLAGAAAALLVAGSARAQDHVNVTISGAALGAIPRLVGAVDIVNSMDLIPITVSGVAPSATRQVFAGKSDAVHATMVLPWNGALTQVLGVARDYFNGQARPVDSVTCDFVHAGSSQPYLSIVLRDPVLSRLTLAYDSVADSATATLAWITPSVEYVTSAGTQPVVRGTAAHAATQPTVVNGVAMQLKPQMAPRVALSPSALRSLAVLGTTGPPAAAFLNLVDAGTRSITFAPEGSFPSWTGGAEASVDAVVLTVTEPAVIFRTTDPNGVQYMSVAPKPRALTSTVQLTKAAGSLAAAIASAQGSGEPLTVTIGLADAPGHLGYRLALTSARVASHSISSANGRTVEQIGLAFQQATLSDTRSGVAMTF